MPFLPENTADGAREPREAALTECQKLGLHTEPISWFTVPQMKAISRRHFLQVAGASLLVAALPAVGGGRNRRGLKRVRVRKLAGQGNPSPAGKAFYRRARFATAADAMRAVAAHRMTAEVYVE